MPTEGVAPAQAGTFAEASPARAPTPLGTAPSIGTAPATGTATPTGTASPTDTAWTSSAPNAAAGDVTRLEVHSFPVNVLDLSQTKRSASLPGQAPGVTTRSPGHTQPHFDAETVRGDFPILKTRVNGKRLVWLDNAATTQKPQSVIDRLTYFYENENSNVHRAAHTLAARATDAYDDARKKVAGFLGASSEKEIVFARGATEAINLVAQSWGRANVRQGDEILITWLEHHANIVPWQQLCQATGATLKVAPVDDNGHVLLDAYAKLLTPRTKLVSFTQVSNALGTITSAAEMTHLAHRVGAVVLVDGAQAVSHMRVDVRAIGCDFYAFSGHKVFAPTGIGALYGRAEILEAMPPWQGGGNMISDVTFDRTTFHGPPMRFEAGTGSIGDAVGLGAAIDWLEKTGLENVSLHEHHLLEYATSELERIPGLRILGNAMPKAGVVSFVIDGVATETIGKALDQEGVAVRSGHHCAQPILRRFGVESTVRASFAPYNTTDDVGVLVDVVRGFGR
ncbi:MAG: cysteine desulfurase [Polyangiaceae bacterium]|nr:cysteine desulfurase [Polyangiaceae bacterium]